ncbi:sensor histidine kinase [Nocardia sp. NBC_01329]|uniref:sensor histidine kinase n=1 Tax=Nocardia sp. NBC_01329 TaxID=2903594 RepID=UPI002E14E8BE|nr:nitrate- and nitrite sensing domain-containing protein [Nocardia sp. NBC_01329]
MAVRRHLPESLVRALRSGRNVTRGRMGIRARLLSIVLITSVTLVVVGVGAAGYLVKASLSATVWAELISSTTTPVISMVQSFEEERRLSLLYLAGDPDAANRLVDARKRSDTALAAVIAKGEAAQRLDPDGSAAELETFRPLYNRVPGVRTAIDARVMPHDEAFGFFSTVVGTIFKASMVAARVAPDAGLGIALGYGVEPLRAAEALSQADTLGAVALTRGELTHQQLFEFTRYTGEVRSQVAYSATVLTGPRLAQLQTITDSPDWHQVIAMQDAVVLRGPVIAAETDGTGEYGDEYEQSAEPETAPLPMTAPAWQEASVRVSSALLSLWESQSRDAHAIARAEGTDTAGLSFVGGIVVLIVTAVALLAALIGANRFIARMRRLRDDTLELADHRLPDLMQRLDNGAEIDTAAEVAHLDFGTDELGEVADAFNRAQVAAVSAAVAEAQTRAGFRTVFLNIAHRNQLAVHRQLALLDKAERQEENADQLELLFELDHLATRARRHAENLIVLGGEQPGRRWRKPVPLWDLIRGAAAESQDYTRIHTGQIPNLSITGLATADLIHLLAELMENATAFSPPSAHVEVSAAVVGRGVAVEVSDRGLGMSAEEITERNELLAQPPDFGVAALTGETRLGLFVVATLAARHGVSVRLTESVYGGIKAVVLIPAALIESANSPEPPAAPAYAAVASPAPHEAAAPAIEGGAAQAQSTPGSTQQVTTAPSPGKGTRPALPRRQRQQADPQPGETPVAEETPRTRTPEQARNLMAAIEGGTRSGRHPRPEPGTADRNRQEGDDDNSSAH